MSGHLYPSSTELDNENWKSIKLAPRNGEYIEIKCTYGVAPWYGLFHWNGNFWESANNPRSGLSEESSEETITWRPYLGKIEDYVDPTGGRQNGVQYWREATVKKYNLPLDHFETYPQTRLKPEKIKSKKSWLEKFLGL